MYNVNGFCISVNTLDSESDYQTRGNVQQANGVVTNFQVFSSQFLRTLAPTR